jgi:hypothetical protein
MKWGGLPLVLVAVSAGAGQPAPAPPLPAEHAHPSGAFTFRTPESWKLEPVPGNAAAVQASSDGIMVRFLYQAGDAGYDSLHVTCMLERLADAMEMVPQVQYEYDFLSWEIDDFRFLDSAFVVKYDKPVQGSKEWRQRNLTVVGKGHSLCAISYAPAKLYKKSGAVRAVLDAVVKSVVFK